MINRFPGKQQGTPLDIQPTPFANTRSGSANEAEIDDRAPLIRRDIATPTDASTEATQLLARAGHLFFGHLPKDLFHMIAGFTSNVDTSAMSQVNTLWRSALDEPRRARPPLRISLRTTATAVTARAQGVVWAQANRFVASLGELTLRSRAHVAQLMHRGTLAGVLESHRTALAIESKRRDREANAVQAQVAGALRKGFFIYATGLMANGLAWAGNKAHGPVVWAYLASIFPSGFVSKYADAEAPGDSKQNATNHCLLMAAGVACAAFKVFSTAAFTVGVRNLATEEADGEAPQASRYVPAALMAGTALADAALCGWAAWHSRQAMQGHEMVEQIDRKISVARATRATLTHVADGLRLCLTGIHDRIDITVEETVPGALAALAARSFPPASSTS